MDNLSNIKMVMDKGHLLSEFERILRVTRSYQTFLSTSPATGEAWTKDAVQALRGQYLMLLQARASLHTVELVCALLRNFLHAIPMERFTFANRQEPASAGNSDAEGIQDEPAEAESGAGEILPWINALAQNAPLEMQEKIQSLLGGLQDFFEQLKLGDATGLELSISRIHLVTVNQQTKSLVREIALITRDVFEALKMVSEDIPLDSLAESSGGISEAVKRLSQVVSRLEEAAEQSLNDLEAVSETAGAQDDRVTGLIYGIQDAQQRLMMIKETHPELEDALTALQNRLSDEAGSQAMAFRQQIAKNRDIYVELISNQGFHELTGRTLKKVNEFVAALEKELIDILQDFRPPQSESPPPDGKPVEAADSEQTQSQEDVDRLLGELGF